MEQFLHCKPTTWLGLRVVTEELPKPWCEGALCGAPEDAGLPTVWPNLRNKKQARGAPETFPADLKLFQITRA